MAKKKTLGNIHFMLWSNKINPNQATHCACTAVLIKYTFNNIPVYSKHQMAPVHLDIKVYFHVKMYWALNYSQSANERIAVCASYNILFQEQRQFILLEINKNDKKGNYNSLWINLSSCLSKSCAAYKLKHFADAGFDRTSSCQTAQCQNQDHN